MGSGDAIFAIEFHMRARSPNKPDAVNPAITSWLHSKHHWRGVTDPERST